LIQLFYSNLKFALRQSIFLFEFHRKYGIDKWFRRVGSLIAICQLEKNLQTGSGNTDLQQFLRLISDNTQANGRQLIFIEPAFFY